MKNRNLRGSAGERTFLVDQFVEMDFGDKKAGDYGGEYVQLYICGWDPVDGTYVMVTPTGVYRGSIVRTYDWDDAVQWDQIEFLGSKREEYPVLALKDSYDD